MTPDPESVAAYLASSPPGFASWWRDAYGEEEFTDKGQREVFVAAAVAWEAALEFAGWGQPDLPPVDPDTELAAHCKGRGLLPPEQPTPHVVTG